jgi:chorismate synthase
MRVALGAVAKKILAEFNIGLGSYVIQIGRVSTKQPGFETTNAEKELWNRFENAEVSPVRCPDPAISKKMVKIIDKAIQEGNSLGGVFEVFVTGFGAGELAWDRN